MANSLKNGRQWRFQDLVDIAAFDSILEELYTATHIPSAIIDMEGNVLSRAGWQKICLDFHRTNPESEKICIQSDVHIKDALRAGESSVIYECPHGLIDSCCPIIVDGHHIANVFTGQLLHSPINDEIRARFRVQAKKFGFDEERYLATLEEVPVFSIDKHKSILSCILCQQN
jgi:ligand-binding sensor protein